MSDNRYLSRYSKYDTHFQRTDPWRHMPFETEKTSKTSEVIGEILGTIAFAIIMIVLVII